MRGNGPYAVMLRQRFEKGLERYGLAASLPKLRTDRFAPAREPDRQMSLFDQ